MAVKQHNTLRARATQLSRLLTKLVIVGAVSAIVLQMPLGAGSMASGASAVCNDPTPMKFLPADGSTDTAVTDPVIRAQVAATKAASNDSEAANRDLRTGTPEAVAAVRAIKEAALQAGHGRGGSSSVLPDRASLIELCTRAQVGATLGDTIGDALAKSVSRADASVGPGYAWVDFLNQQGQLDPTWCGPASLSEIANTMANNGRLSNPVSQATGASYMGTNGDGTSVTNMLNGLNNYVGIPIAGWAYYNFIWVPLSVTQADRDTFLDNVAYDATNGWPVAGDAWEEVDGPHLVGHPNAVIFHWFEIGGYGSSGAQTYYADSATSVWGGVAAFSWYDRNTMADILGGRGYAW